jgi:hypothetical protein
MRASSACLVLSCTVFGSSLAFTRQDDPPAEQRFRNIQSFKGEKSSSVIPAMEFISASLGVGCDFCHTADRASDEKRPKQTAREMIAMQHDINTKFFDGRLQVTCSTCHAGHTHPVAFPPVAGLEVRPRRANDILPDQVLATYSKAVGEDPAHPITSLELRGTSEEHGAKAPVAVVYSGAKYAFMERGPKGDQKQGFDGDTAWFTTPTGIQKVPWMFAEQYVKMNSIFAGRATLPALTSPSGATAQINGKDQLVLNGTLTGETTRLSLYFDKQTGLLTRTTYTYPTILGSIAQINDYSNYRRVNGVLIPMTVINHSSQGDAVMRYRSAHANVTVDPASFAPPKATS